MLLEIISSKENTVLELNISPEVRGKEDTLILEISPKCALSLLRFYQPQIPAIHRILSENKTSLKYNKIVTPLSYPKWAAHSYISFRNICSNFLEIL